MTDVLARLAAALADRYRIERELGQGGMATVHLAEDLRHHRKVAIKVLRPELAAVLGAERFVQEITTTAALSHPHILPLFDSGTAEGFLYYVMPYVEGETLRNKLDREKQLGVDEAVKLTTEVADALDYAHRHGVIHRDIKPENILLHDGRPMVADFGIALAVSAAAGGRMTETGLSLGTPHYMSPEQATAEKEITARSDVYSLASVLYEMLAGQPPHLGGSAQQIIMKIVTDQARPVTELRKAVPPNVAAALAKALEKLPADRFDSARAFAEALGNTHFTVEGTAAGLSSSTGGPWRRRFQAALAAVALLSVVLAATVWLAVGRFAGEKEGAPAPVVAFTLMDSVPRSMAAALASDGSLAFVRDRTILVRHPGEVSEFPVSGAENVLESLRPVFSPDGQQIAYVTETGTGQSRVQTLRRIATHGGTPATILSLEPGQFVRIEEWTEDDWIYFARFGRAAGPSLRRIRATGGAEEEVLSLEDFVAGVSHIAGSDALVMCLIGRTTLSRRVIALDESSRDTVLVGSDICSPAWSPTGHLLVATMDGAVDAIPFEAGRLRVTGPATRALDNVATFDAVASYAVNRAGTLLYLAGPAQRLRNTGGGTLQLAFVDLAGRRTDLPLPPTDHPDAALSPDGRQLAYTRSDQIWLYDLDLGTHRQFTTAGSGHHNPVWSPDGKRIAYRSLREEGGEGDVYVQGVAGDSAARRVGGTSVGDNPSQWLDDGTILAYTDGTNQDILSFQVDRPGAATPVLHADWIERRPAVSPDGRWLAFFSAEGEEDGRDRLTIRSWPALGKKLVVSDTALFVSDPPVWSADSRTLYYSQGAHLLAASLAGTDSLRVVSRRVVIDSFPMSLRSLHPDGRRFLVFASAPRLDSAADSAAAHAPRRLIVVTNWLTALKDRLGRAGSK